MPGRPALVSLAVADGPHDGVRLAAADVQRHAAGRLVSFTAIASGLRDG